MITARRGLVNVFAARPEGSTRRLRVVRAGTVDQIDARRAIVAATASPPTSCGQRRAGAAWAVAKAGVRRRPMHDGRPVVRAGALALEGNERKVMTSPATASRRFSPSGYRTLQRRASARICSTDLARHCASPLPLDHRARGRRGGPKRAALRRRDQRGDHAARGARRTARSARRACPPCPSR